MKYFLGHLVILVWMIANCGVSAMTLSPIVSTSLGSVQGFQSQNMNQFLGIPFAQPPTGDLRFAAPQDPTPWQGVLNATQIKPGCPQNCVLPKDLCPAQISEDCLYLSVYTPLNFTSTSRKPVMVFIYGGAFMYGTTHTPVYRPSFLVPQGDVVFVQGEYRLGAFGYFANAGLDPNCEDCSPGNMGFLDQQKVLFWVQKNIAAFGGDPNNVLLFGESAGAMSVSTHMVSPTSKNLFHRVVIESDPYSLEIPTLAEQNPRAKKLADKLGCSATDMACLRGKDMASVLAASDDVALIPDPFQKEFLQAILAWRPTISETHIPNQILPSFQNGQFHKVPIMLGTNTNEGRLFAYEIVSFIDNLEYSAALLYIFGTDADKVLKEYPVTLDPVKNVIGNFSEILTDYLFACPSRMVAQLLDGQVPVYLYHFDVSGLPAGKTFWGPSHQYCWDYV